MFRLATREDSDRYFSYFLLSKFKSRTGDIKRITLENGLLIDYRSSGTPVKVNEKDWYCLNI